MTGGVLALLGLMSLLVLAFVAAKRLEARYGDRAFSAFILRRMAWLALTVLVVFTITFFLMRAVPGGPFDEERRLLPEVKRNLEIRYGLDRPLHEQYASALLGLLRFDFGPCLSQRDWSVRDVLLLGLPPSLLLGFAALFWALLIGLPAGFWAARKRGTAIDTVLTALTSLGMAVPNFVLALLLILIFSFRLKLFAPAGLLAPADLFLPSLTLGLPFAAQVARLFRTGLLDVTGQDFIRTAYAKGLSERRVLLHHAFLPASIPVITFLGPALAGILTGSLVIEQVFAIPGLGTHFVQGALNRDYTLSLGMVVLFTALVSFLNLLCDVLVAAIDPRVKLK